MRTNQNYTFEILGGFVMSNNNINVEYLADQIDIVCWNEHELYNLVTEKRRRAESIAKNYICSFINIELGFAGYKNYYCTYAQVKKYFKDHGDGLQKVIDILVNHINEYRKIDLGWEV